MYGARKENFYFDFEIASSTCPVSHIDSFDMHPVDQFLFFLVIFSVTLVVEGSFDVAEEAKEDNTVVEREEEASCARLLAAAAERVWDIFLQNKREVK